MKLNPNDQFKVTEKSVQAVLTSYSLRLVSFEAAKTGIENTTVIVNTDSGKFVLRIYRQNKKIDAEIKEEIGFTNFLTQNKLPVPKVVLNSQQEQLTATTVDGLRWQVILMEYMPGTHAERYTSPLVKSMAQVQAEMHLLSERYDYNKDVFPMLVELRETVIIKQIVKEDIADSRLLGFVERAEKYVLPLPGILPAGICHLDYSKGNILTDGNDEVAAILDFDDMEAAPYAVCLGFALYHLLLGNAGKAEQAEYLAQYEAVRRLSALERNILPSIALFRHYFIGSVQIFHQRRAEQDIVRYLEVEHSLLQKV
jgi:Ser/Thr protein kinase RdoA (MazF antagonist)